MNNFVSTNQPTAMHKLRKLNLSRQQADLLLVSVFFIAAILATIIFRINGNTAYYQTLK